LIQARRPIDAVVHWKLGKRRLRLPTRSTVLGGGLLERARSTTLALLGVTAAVGLGTVALALNQSWPLLAGSPIPGIPSGDVALEDATVVSRAPRNGRGGEAGSADRPREGERRGGEGSGRDRGATGAAPGPRGSSQIVVAASTPVDSETGGGPDRPAAKKPKPAPAPAAKPEAAAPAPAPAAAAQPAVSPPPAAEPAEEPPSGASAAGTEPEESGPPSWSNGDGHGYGRGRSDWHGHDHGHHDWDDDDRDWDRDRDWHD
jgi:hypothetical protein